MSGFKNTTALMLGCGLLIAPLLFVGAFVHEKHVWAEAHLAELEPRHARLLGLDQAKDDLASALLRAKEMRSKLSYPAATEPVQAANDAQQRIRDVFTRTGVQIISSQALATKTEQWFDRIPLSFRVEGELLPLNVALGELQKQEPLILLEDADFQVRSTPPNAEPYLAVQLNFSVFRDRLK